MALRRFRRGRGVEILKGGGRYEGEWEADERFERGGGGLAPRHGRGVEECSDGVTYEGEWRGGVKCGAWGMI
jgi:hypothetical protein